jgi:hypothetical protein
MYDGYLKDCLWILTSGSSYIGNFCYLCLFFLRMVYIFLFPLIYHTHICCPCYKLDILGGDNEGNKEWGKPFWGSSAAPDADSYPSVSGLVTVVCLSVCLMTHWTISVKSFYSVVWNFRDCSSAQPWVWYAQSPSNDSGFSRKLFIWSHMVV